MRFLKWFYPGMQVKRWVGLALAGIVFFGVGAALLTIESDVVQRAISLAILLIGLVGVLMGGLYTVKSLLEVVSPSEDKDLVEKVFQRRHLEKGPKVVAIGGGTGLSRLLKGLKEYTNNITAVVTVADDGGSSGRLRQEFDMIPPGDIRNCLVALADTEPLMQQLFQYRFPGNSALQGHSFGNLFITAMTKITGDFEKAVQASSKVLAIRGRVVPATNTKAQLVAEHEDGSKTYGETNISEAEARIKRMYLEPKDCKPTQEAIDAIRDAHVIVFGPGSLYTSVVPNLVVPGMSDEIRQSKALKVYVCNVMTQYRETEDYSASDHVKALLDHTGPDMLHACLVNTRPIPKDVLERYKEEKSTEVEADLDNIEALGVQVIADNFVTVDTHVRHNAEKIAKSIVHLIINARGRLGGNVMQSDIVPGNE